MALSLKKRTQLVEKHKSIITRYEDTFNLKIIEDHVPDLDRKYGLLFFVDEENTGLRTCEENTGLRTCEENTGLRTCEETPRKLGWNLIKGDFRYVIGYSHCVSEWIPNLTASALIIFDKDDKPEYSIFSYVESKGDIERNIEEISSSIKNLTITHRDCIYIMNNQTIPPCNFNELL